jgi:MYXO-CTERM domain-containing protein
MLTVALFARVALADPPASDALEQADDGLARPPAAWDLVPFGVTGGEDVPSAETWPDAAGIWYRGYQGPSCTGVLIAPDVVLTAGHCASGVDAVQLGVNDWRDDGGEMIDVVDVIEYPDSWETYDIAVLLLDQPSSYEPRVIGTDCVRDYIVDGAEVTIVGYGAIDRYGYQYTPDLQQGVSEITDADCSSFAQGCNRSVYPDGELGAGGDGVDACYGDSGGPLYLETPNGTYVIGIVSRGWYGADCGEGGVWVRPDKDELFEWIEEVAGVTLARPQACSMPPDPVAAPIYTPKNTVGQTEIDPRDPEGDPVSYRVVAGPGQGAVDVMADGVVRYTPPDGWKGSDAVVVEVTDSAGLSAQVEIPIKVLSKSDYKELTGEGGGCGCASSSPAGFGLAGLLGLAALIRRKR